MTTAAKLALSVLETFSGPYYTAQTDTQRLRVMAEAARHVAPMISEIEQAAQVRTAANPT